MQRSSSSSALSKISKAVFGVKHMDTVECSIFNFFIPLRDLEKNKLPENPNPNFKFNYDRVSGSPRWSRLLA